MPDNGAMDVDDMEQDAAIGVLDAARTFDRSRGTRPSFDRQQYSVGLGGPLVKGRVWWFGAAEYRNQDARLLSESLAPYLAAACSAAVAERFPVNRYAVSGGVIT